MKALGLILASLLLASLTWIGLNHFFTVPRFVLWLLWLGFVSLLKEGLKRWQQKASTAGDHQ